jgi:hypothetical protein
VDGDQKVSAHRVGVLVCALAAMRIAWPAGPSLASILEARRPTFHQTIV